MNEYPRGDVERLEVTVESERPPSKGFLAGYWWLLVCILILLFGTAAWVFLLKPRPQPEGEVVVTVAEPAAKIGHEPPPFGEVYHIRDLIINPAGGRRHFMVSIGLEFFNTEKGSEIERREPILRDNLITFFGSQPVEVLTNLRYRQSIRSRIKKIVDYQLGEGVVSRIFFEKWVIE